MTTQHDALKQALDELIRRAYLHAEGGSREHYDAVQRIRREIEDAALSLQAAQEQPAAQSGQDAIPELHNIREAKVYADFAVHVVFASCRAACAFKATIDAAMQAQRKEKSNA